METLNSRAPADQHKYKTRAKFGSGIDGIDSGLEAPPPSETPYEAEAGPLLPRTLGDAIDAFDRSGFYRSTLGDEIVDYLVALKRSEWTRFGAAVTDWEQREYYDTF